MKKKKIIEMRYAVDIPNANSEDWICIDYFETKKEAIKFVKEKFGGDKEGKVSLISSL